MKDIIFGLTVGQTYNVGMTALKASTVNKLRITHHGSMGSTMEQINQNLNSMNLLNIDEFKSQFEIQKEEGSPDYYYSIEILINKPKMK